MSFEYFFNSILRLDPYIEKLLIPLENKTISITCSDFPDKAIYCVFNDLRINLSFSRPTHVDTDITAPLSGLISLAVNKQNADIRAAQLTMHGDLATAENFQKLLFSLDIDWEEKLSKYTGDVIAHQAIYMLKQLKQYRQESTSNLETMLTEYLQEESGLAPTHYEVNDFMQEVDQLRLQVDRLEARIKIHESA